MRGVSSSRIASEEFNALDPKRDGVIAPALFAPDSFMAGTSE